MRGVRCRRETGPVLRKKPGFNSLIILPFVEPLPAAAGDVVSLLMGTSGGTAIDAPVNASATTVHAMIDPLAAIVQSAVDAGATIGKPCRARIIAVVGSAGRSPVKTIVDAIPGSIQVVLNPVAAPIQAMLDAVTAIRRRCARLCHCRRAEPQHCHGSNHQDLFLHVSSPVSGLCPDTGNNARAVFRLTADGEFMSCGTGDAGSR
jgi:hypothetical protein